MMMTAHAIIADDEANLAEYLRARLHELWPELEVDAVARNGQEAIAAIELHRPHVAFLDIKMPGLSGLDVASRVIAGGLAVHIVFVTGFNR